MTTYEIVGMFATAPRTGSSLGVVPDASELSTEEMSRIAKALEQPETAFALPPTQVGASHAVRVFTADGVESPFGGHSAAGTAATLVRLGVLAPGPAVQECGPRLMELTAEREQATVLVADPPPGDELDPEPLLRATGLDAGALAGPARTEGFGPAFHFLPVEPGAVARATWLTREAAGPAGDLADVFVFSWDGDTATATARMFAPGYGMPEDPACASAALGLGPWLVETGRLPRDDGRYGYTVLQGAGGPRPAELRCEVTVSGGRATAASASGAVLGEASGRCL